MPHLVLAAGVVGDVRGQLGRGRYRSRDPGLRDSGRGLRGPRASRDRAGRDAARRLAAFLGEHLVLREHAGVEVAEFGPWVDAELVGDGVPRLPVRVERLRVAARAIQRPHQQDPQVFPERMVGQEPA